MHLGEDINLLRHKMCHIFRVSKLPFSTQQNINETKKTGTKCLASEHSWRYWMHSLNVPYELKNGML